VEIGYSLFVYREYLLYQLQKHWCNTSGRRNISCTESGYLLNGNLPNLGK